MTAAGGIFHNTAVEVKGAPGMSSTTKLKRFHCCQPPPLLPPLTPALCQSTVRSSFTALYTSLYSPGYEHSKPLPQSELTKQQK